MAKRKKQTAARAEPARGRGRPPEPIDTSTDRGEFGARLRRLREESGLSQDAAAAALEVPKCTYNNWERGRTYPPYDRMSPLATVLDCGIADLFPEGD